jgi:hypothetical protein
MDGIYGESGRGGTGGLPPEPPLDRETREPSGVDLQGYAATMGDSYGASPIHLKVDKRPPIGSCRLSARRAASVLSGLRPPPYNVRSW